MKKTGEDRVCPICKRMFHAPQWKIDRGIGLRCSSKCYGESKQGTEPWNKGTRGIVKPNGGTFTKGAHKWGGTIQEYKALHYWVNKYLGKPPVCEHCQKEEDGRKIHWANISGEYRKEVGDWIRLCVSCHYKFDKQYERRRKNRS